MSGNTLLLTFTGRKSGKQYSTPISYAREGNTLTLVTHRQHGWWKNLQEPAPIHARVQGQDLCGTAHTVTLDTPALVDEVQKVYRGIPPERAVQLAPDVVLIKIELN
jgi:hypothetical protein